MSEQEENGAQIKFIKKEIGQKIKSLEASTHDENVCQQHQTLVEGQITGLRVSEMSLDMQSTADHKLDVLLNDEKKSKAPKDVKIPMPWGGKLEMSAATFGRLLGLILLILAFLKLHGYDIRKLIPGEQGNENAEVVVTETVQE